jgi:hypothetical protein
MVKELLLTYYKYRGDILIKQGTKLDIIGHNRTKSDKTGHLVFYYSPNIIFAIPTYI